MEEHLSEAEKRTHASVDYEHPSKHAGEFCAICRHYISGNPPACHGVRQPIHPADWCHRWLATRPSRNHITSFHAHKFTP